MRKILVIDDDAQVRKVISVILSKNGFTVFESGNGCSALSILETEAVDLIITDILMPEKDGLETIAESKALWPRLKIIAMSGGGLYMDPALYLRMAKIIGADVVFNKPVGMKKLLQTIHDLFEAELVAETVTPI